MFNQKGVIHLFLPLLLLLIIVAGVFGLTKFGFIKLPQLPSIPFLQKGANVQLKSDYKNPFKKETQYVNPFEKYKNPFVVNK